MIYNKKYKRGKQKMKNAESLAAVHTHTHTHVTFTNEKTLVAFLYPNLIEN